MNTARTTTTRLLLGIWITATVVATAARNRARQLEGDRGDVPGWAIASGAACVLALVVYTAYSGVINKWTASIK